MQRKAKEKEARSLEQEHINESLKELNREEKESFERYGFIFFIILYYLRKKKGFWHSGECAVIPALLTLFYISMVMRYVAFLPTPDRMCVGGPMRL